MSLVPGKIDKFAVVVVRRMMKTFVKAGGRKQTGEGDRDS